MAKKPKKPAKPPAVIEPKAKPKASEVCFEQFRGLGLNLQQQLFVIAYVRPDVGFNATRAYIEAYDYEGIDDYMVAGAAACRLLKDVRIQKAVSIEITRLTSDHKRLAQAVLDSWAATAFGDWTDVLETASGLIVKLRSIEDIPPHMRTQIQSIENTQSGIKVTLCSRDKAKENIAKSLGMFVEVNQSVGNDYESLVHQLAREEAEGKNVKA